MTTPQPEQADREDYRRVLAEYGLDAAEVRRAIVNDENLSPMPEGFAKLKVGPSSIDGLGLIAAAPIARWELIAPAVIDGVRTPVARYTNHSPRPTARVERGQGDDLLLYAKYDIPAGRELTVDYRQLLVLVAASPAADRAESLRTLRMRAESLAWLGGAWAKWAVMPDSELADVLNQLLDVDGHLPSIDDVEFATQTTGAST